MTTTVAIEAGVAADQTDDPFRDLVSAARAGDRAALEALVESIERRVYTLAYRLVGERATAEDVAQEVFIKVCRRLDQYRGGTSFLAWVYRITVNQACDFRRAAGPATEEAVEIPVGPGFDAGREEQLGRLMDAMKLLSEKERAALVLIDVEGFTSIEAARVLGCMAVTARVRATQARKKIRRALSRYYPELREAT